MSQGTSQGSTLSPVPFLICLAGTLKKAEQIIEGEIKEGTACERRNPFRKVRLRE